MPVSDDLRTIIGSFCFVGMIVLFWCIAYKCITCLHAKERSSLPVYSSS